MLPETLAAELIPAPEPLYYRRGSPDDPRLGELVHRGSAPSGMRPDAVLLGIPQDLGVRRNQGRPGAAKGPDAIRRALYRMTPEALHSDLSQLCLVDIGNLRTVGKTLEELHELQFRCVAHLLEQSGCVIVLGGGHDIAYPNARAMAQYAREYAVLVFDAHPDVRPLVNGRAHSGSAFRQLLEGTPPFPGRRLAYIGLQPFAIAGSHREFLEQHGALLCFLPELQPGKLLERVRQFFERISDGGLLPVYVSLDLDALPASVAPGVSAPSPIGLPAQELLESLQWLGTQRAVRLFDLAEYAPAYDLDGRTARMAALCLCALLSGRAGIQERSGD